MDIKQESDDLIKDPNLELVFIKQEKDDDPPTEYFQEPSIHSSGSNQIIDGADKNWDLVQKDNTRKGLSLDGKSMKKRNPHGRIFLCIVCGYMSIKEIEFLSHSSSIHFFNQKNIFKTKINRKYGNKIRSKVTYRGSSIDANVKDEIEIVHHEMNEELDEIGEHANLFKNIDDSKICSNKMLVVSDHMCYCSQNGNNPVECKICSKISQQRRSVNRPCQIDGKSLESECCFKKHLCIYTDEKLDICSSAFTAKGHLNETHTGQKLFKCNICSKCFSQNCNLKYHLRTHTGEKPFKCNVCPKSFSQKVHLNYHLRTHNGEKPFKCNVCTKYFSRKSQLVSHLRIHTGEKPFRCNVCTKSFSHETSLKYHLRTHTGEKTFKCNVCTKSFSRGDTLKCHLRTHTGEKPFKCDVCTKSFSQGSNLKSHYLTHKILFT